MTHVLSFSFASSAATPSFGLEINKDTHGGLLVRRIVPGGAAALDGRLRKDDVLLAINGMGVVSHLKFS
jgi:C-terminal processing protease CtpA/Prc